jgi:hypothetical protein
MVAVGVGAGRHSLGRKIFQGRSGQLYQRYQDGMEDQIGALGLVLNVRAQLVHGGVLPHLPGGLRPLRDKGATDEE